jgi:hypothetical protein
VSVAPRNCRCRIERIEFDVMRKRVGVEHDRRTTFGKGSVGNAAERR